MHAEQVLYLLSYLPSSRYVFSERGLFKLSCKRGERIKHSRSWETRSVQLGGGRTLQSKCVVHKEEEVMGQEEASATLDFSLSISNLSYAGIYLPESEHGRLVFDVSNFLFSPGGLES